MGDSDGTCLYWAADVARRHKFRLIAALAVLAASFAPVQDASAAFKTLYSFCKDSSCTDGSAPGASPVADATGNLYGETRAGGAAGKGVVYKLAFDAATGKWTQTVLHSFCATAGCPDGASPAGRLLLVGSDTLYGVTQFGGANGQGAVYQMTYDAGTKLWQQAVIYSFCDDRCQDGANPLAGLMIDGSGNLFGTSSFGGLDGQGDGVVYELTPNAAHTQWTQKVLHIFCNLVNCITGASPSTGLVMDSNGFLYGTTSRSQFTPGVAYQLALDGTYTVLHYFCSASLCADGAFPTAGLTLDNHGNLYGTAFYGNDDGLSQLSGPGVAFKLAHDASGTIWTETVLTPFCTIAIDCPFGSNPIGRLVFDHVGNLYGTGSTGGAQGLGEVFELRSNFNASKWTPHALHSFNCAATRCPSGTAPLDGPTFDAVGNLFGVTMAGGAGLRQGGTVYELTGIAAAAQ